MDNQLTIEGFSVLYYFVKLMDKNIILKHKVMDIQLVKVQWVCLIFKIDNDLKMVDTAIREYYGFNEDKEIEKGKENDRL